MSEQQIRYPGATEALARFADRGLSPVEPMRAIIARSCDDRRVVAAALAFEREFAAPPWRIDSRITRGE